LIDRIRNESLRQKIITAQEAAAMIRDGMKVATSGFTPSGYPKAVPMALVERVKRTGESLKIDLFTGASTGDELDELLAVHGLIARRFPYQTSKALRQGINAGEVMYADMHLSHAPQFVDYGFWGEIDLAIIEAAAITEEGHLVPTTSVGISPTFVKHARRVIVEINLSQPLEIEGIHDIFIPEKPPMRRPIQILRAFDRIGRPCIEISPEKIAGIVITDIPDGVKDFAPVKETHRRIARNLIGFFEKEVSQGRMDKSLGPLQSGVGSVANAVLSGLLDSDFDNLVMYTEVIQDAVLDLIDSGKVTFASGCSLTPSPEGRKRLMRDFSRYRERIVLRPQEISNHPEVIRRLGVIAMNTAIEVDIFGNVNSTHQMGSRIMNGIGGSGDFTRNSALAIFTTESIAKNGDISCVVPMVSHCDHTEHDVDIIVTDQGLADLRGLAPVERARRIIDNCAHPLYRDRLLDYLNRGIEAGGHTPVLLEEALSWHLGYEKEGRM
jgi:succinyl-CoA:acetate CoA-transferase